jgi:ketosteroid isomerase-like protein
MKIIPNPSKLFSVLAIVCIAFLYSCADSGPTDVTEEIRKANEEFIAAFNANDAARLTAVYTADAILYPANSDAVSGSGNIQAYWQAGFDAGIANGSLDTQKATAYGDTAIENGTFEIGAADGTMIDKGKYLVVWKKVNGAWKYYQDIWNSSLPLPVPEPEAAPAENAADTVE